MTSVPKLSLDAVPIQIICCKKLISYGDKGHNDVEAFTSSWKSVLHAVESAKNYASSATKYQQNFCLLMQDVLRSNHHLFTDDEKNFMGINSNTKIFLFLKCFHLLIVTIFHCYLLTESFISLSNDSQRLFVRLYTRKGY